MQQVPKIPHNIYFSQTHIKQAKWKHKIIINSLYFPKIKMQCPVCYNYDCHVTCTLPSTSLSACIYIHERIGSEMNQRVNIFSIIKRLSNVKHLTSTQRRRRQWRQDKLWDVEDGVPEQKGVDYNVKVFKFI